MVHFQLLEANASIPSGYRLATKQDVEDNRHDFFLDMPGWGIANLVDGSVDGPRYGGNVSDETRNETNQKLAIEVLQPVTFKLFDVNEELPREYRQATVQEVYANPEALQAAMSGDEIANLVNGSVDGANHGWKISLEIQDDNVSKQLAVPENAPDPPSKFKLFRIGDQLPPSYRLATKQMVYEDSAAWYRAMPGRETAKVADGTVHGVFYKARSSPDKPDDVRYQLAVQAIWITARELPARSDA